MIAEETGAIRFLNTRSKEWLFSVQCQSNQRLFHVEWNHADPNMYIFLLQEFTIVVLRLY
jgi:hypothetical protein